MKSNLIKITLLAIGMLFVLSAYRDIMALIKHYNNKRKVLSYISTEIENINNEKERLFDRIKTSINFKSGSRKTKYEQFLGIDTLSVIELEKLIITMFPDVKTLDSIFFYGEDIARIREQMINSDETYLKEFYEHNLTIPILETLAHQVYDDSNFGWNESELVRSLGEDSVYVASWGDTDGFTKYAFRINGRYFSEKMNATNYNAPKVDTLYIETLEIRNRGTYIDTFSEKATLVYDGNLWKTLLISK